MKKKEFYIVDVFAEQKYAGNQLAVFRDAGLLEDDEMQQIAKEINYSETTFILSGKQENNGYDVRIFTPNHEVPFAGHPALGTAYIIQREIIKKPVKKIKLNFLAGQIPIAFKYDNMNSPNILWMKQNEPVFSKVIGTDQVSEVLNLDAEDMDNRFPVQEVSTGLPFIIVPLKTLDAVKKAKVNKDKYEKLISEKQAKAIFIFCPETYNPANKLNARMFADYYGIPEDPATGSAGGCLAGYLTNYRYMGEDKVNVRVEQGYEIGRPSLLYLRAEKYEDHIEVNVGGKVVMVAKGDFI